MPLPLSTASARRHQFAGIRDTQNPDVWPGPAVRIAGGAAASPGDLIICPRNDHKVEAGEPGRTLANGDLLRIDAVTPGGLAGHRGAIPRARARSPPARRVSPGGRGPIVAG
jgi:hypothetical protein